MNLFCLTSFFCIETIGHSPAIPVFILELIWSTKNDSSFRWMWLTIVLSFAFYIPVVLWADVIPMIGMLMIPKTCAYVWTVLIGYKAIKKRNSVKIIFAFKKKSEYNCLKQAAGEPKSRHSPAACFTFIDA